MQINFVATPLSNNNSATYKYYNAILCHMLVSLRGLCAIKVFVYQHSKAASLLQVSCSTEGVHVFHLQSPLHQQFNRDPRVPYSSGNRSRVTYGCKLLRLLTSLFTLLFQVFLLPDVILGLLLFSFTNFDYLIFETCFTVYGMIYC